MIKRDITKPVTLNKTGKSHLLNTAALLKIGLVASLCATNIALIGTASQPGLTSLLAATATAQSDDKKDKKKDEDKTIEKKVEDYERIDGLFQLYRNPKNGALYMEITEDQLGREFIAFSYTENSALPAGGFRGAYGAQQIISPKKYYDKIEFIEKSTSFYFDPENPLARASDANISESVLSSLKIEATTKGSGEGDERKPERYLIAANSLFLSDAFQQLKPSPNPNTPPGAFNVGELSSSQTHYDEIRNYPSNTDVIVDYVFRNKYPSNPGGDSITDPRSVKVKMQHSIIAMPNDGYEPRIDDYRVGYFFDRVTDLTSDSSTNYRDLITRWRLEKKDPDAALSEPVKPITWWIENTTPLEYRDTIRDAVLAWNLAFEKAGFKNAVEVKIQPDDADWDAGDIRYNVLRWTSSPIPPFGGYGPSFSNPRTGELLGADIMLEYTFITNRARISEIFDLNATNVTTGETETPNLIPLDGKSIHCSAGHHLKMSNLFGRTVLAAQGNNDEADNQLIKEGLYYLMLHEVGHTLGLNHNMKASIQYGPREVHDASITNGAPTGSVMDYPAVNIAPDGVTQGDYYMKRPGPYDDWAIEFGYRPGLDPIARKALLARSGEKGLAFGNDADDMRAPGRGIDPQVNINDLSSDPIAYAIDRIKLSKSTLPKLLNKYNDKNSWQDLVQAYLITTGQHASMASVISRQVGGVYVNRQAPGTSDTAPYTPVPKATQKTAIKTLGQYIFAGDAFPLPADLAARLQPQRRGYDFGAATEDPKIHSRIFGIQMSAIAHLLHPVVLERMVNSSLYGANYTPGEMLVDLNEAVIGNDLKGSPNTFRRNLQIGYVQRLASIVNDPSYPPEARNAAQVAIADVKSRFGLFDFNLSAETKAHRTQLNRILRQAL